MNTITHGDFLSNGLPDASVDLIIATNKDNKIKFGLKAQGHIETIEAELKRWNEGAEVDMSYSVAVWQDIGKKIGWEPFSAALAYFRYLNEKKTDDNDNERG